MLCYNTCMNIYKLRNYAVAFLCAAIVIVVMTYKLSKSEFNIKGDKFMQSQKVGFGYVRMGRAEYSSPEYFLLGDFTANMATPDKSRKFVRVEIRLKMSDSSMERELRDENIRLRDAVIEEMSLKDFSEVSTPHGKLVLKDNIRKRLNDIVREGEIEEVFFTKFVVR